MLARHGWRTAGALPMGLASGRQLDSHGDQAAAKNLGNLCHHAGSHGWLFVAHSP